jgi:2-succinyl-6-hydroxy-2,4-cyclohexadiene-1-carboxylate synthase
MQLLRRESWEDSGVRVVFVHGFSQTADSWERVAAELPATAHPIALEVPEGLDFESTAISIGIRGGRGTYVGYSMGGRLCLQLALDRPEVVDRLVLVSASPGIESEKERAARRGVDDRLALEIERDGVEAFLDRWLAQPLFASLPRDLARVEERRRGNSVDRLTHELRVLGQGAQPSLWSRLSELTMPVLLVTGVYDRRYTELAARMAATIGPHASHIRIDDAGHAVPLEQPEALARALATL